MYEIIIRGCCDSTKIEIELTPDELKGIIKLAEASSDVFIKDGMTYPSIEDIFCLDAGDTWLLWNAKAYKDEKKDSKNLTQIK